MMIHELTTTPVATATMDDLPPLPAGFGHRPATIDDVPAVVELLNACTLASVGAAEFDLATERKGWQTPGFDPPSSTRLVFAPDGRLAAFGLLWDVAPVPVQVWPWNWVHPDFEGVGLGWHLLAWGERLARRVLARVPHDARVVLRAGTVSSYRPAKALLAAYGFRIVRHFWRMGIVLDERPAAPEWPLGLENGRSLTLRSLADLAAARGYDAATLAVFRAKEEAFRDHWGHVDQPEETAFQHWMYQMFEELQHDPALWLLAMDGDEIAGLSLCRRESVDEPDRGWIQVLAVRRPWRHRGLGLALLQQSFRTLYELGQRQAGLAVDAASLTGATRLYEKAGMVAYRQYDTYEKELRPGRNLITEQASGGGGTSEAH